MNMYPILRWVAISGSSMATSACLALSAVAQSTPPPGVTIPPNAPDAVEQSIPKPSELPRTLPSERPTLPPLPQLQTPPTPESPEVTPPSSDRIFIKKVEVLGNTVLQNEIAALTQTIENREIASSGN